MPRRVIHKESIRVRVRARGIPKEVVEVPPKKAKGWIWALVGIMVVVGFFLIVVIRPRLQPSLPQSPKVAIATPTPTPTPAVSEGEVPMGFTEEGAPYRGNPDAPVTLVEHSEFQ